MKKNDLLYVYENKKPESYEYLNFSINVDDGHEMWLGVAVIIQMIRPDLI